MTLWAPSVFGRRILERAPAGLAGCCLFRRPSVVDPSRSDLRGANLGQTNLERSNLRGTNGPTP